jgi:4-amino-4-deoxy-L-arabinose transferase-like glycosyltransferase
VVLAGAAARTVWLHADPPVVHSVGIVWHDEGAWVHNARNRALWGHWRTDEWNPVFVAPVFTALEFESFHLFGVGLLQARLVPVLSGLAAILAVFLGLRRLSGSAAALSGAALLSASYTFLMWNRAALMESTLAAFLTAAWAAYVYAERRPVFGWAAGLFAVLAWFTKASAAFFIAAIALDAVMTMARAAVRRGPGSDAPRPATTARVRAAAFTLAGLALAAAVVGVLFVLPHWTEYRFYNWQMSVTRKPVYTVHAVLDRLSWLPVAQGLFTRSWLVLAAGTAGLFTVLLRRQTATPGERLLVSWVVIGLLELVAHDAGNERRYVMFIPAFAALASLFLCQAGAIAPEGADRDRRARWIAAPVVLLLSYVVIGSLLRPMFQQAVDAGRFSAIVRISAVLAGAGTLMLMLRWSALAGALARTRVAPQAAALWIAAAVVVDGVQFAEWARAHRQVNYEASVALGARLPPGTVVQGKLANGLSLENRIRPFFVGNGFGNYDGRFDPADGRYILTYDLPRLGYESSDGSGLIGGILALAPGWRQVATFDVDETPDRDRAVLIDKFPNGLQPDARH